MELYVDERSKQIISFYLLYLENFIRNLMVLVSDLLIKGSIFFHLF